VTGFNSRVIANDMIFLVLKELFCLNLHQAL
jgi:hypothetical protein